ncbi:MAG: ABC transporter ATP-binding protein/permease, partial [Lachnospiraceae bacterium]|nr:ABC transporter ATP-binding protein/permease [Lachnospiraceae bacterium]
VLFLSMLLAGFTILNNVVSLYVSPTILSVVEKREPASKLVLTILGFTGAMMLCSAGLSYISANLPYGKITVRQAVLENINRKTMTTSYPNVNDDAFIKLVAKCQTVTNDNICATEAIWETLTGLLHDSVCFILWLLLLSSIDPLMIAVILVTSVIGYFVNRYVSGYEYRHRDELSGCEKRLWYISNRARDYGAAKDIRIFGMRPWLMQLEERAMAAYMAVCARAEGAYAWGRIADLILTLLRNGIAYFYLIRLVISGEITAAQFLLYFSAVGGFTMWVCGILRNLVELHRQCLDISIVRECLEYPECFKFEDGESLKPDPKGKYEIRLENVSFCYPGAGKETLSNINLTLHSGEKLAIVGVNGAGKTTLVRLICGMYDPTGGRVLLNGRDIREYNRRDYYALFSAVFQNFSILAGSIAANIAQTEDGIDMERVRKCVEEAGLKEKIEALGGRYGTLLDRKVYEEAIELSGGETQRLMLARALYKDAPVIVLDEPTAALDPIAESELYQKYNEMTAGRLSVYISHRLASTRFCDRIILLAENRIAEEGTHEELLEKNGRYAELFAVQSRYYQENGGVPGEEVRRGGADQ